MNVDTTLATEVTVDVVGEKTAGFVQRIALGSNGDRT